MDLPITPVPIQPIFILQFVLMQPQQVAEKLVFAVFAVIPAKAGIQFFLAFLDSRLRGSDKRLMVFSSLLALKNVQIKGI